MFDKLYILDRRFQEVATRCLPKFPVTSASTGPQRETKGTSYLEVAQVGVLALWATPQLLILMSFKSHLVQATYHNAVTLCSFHRYYFFFSPLGSVALGPEVLVHSCSVHTYHLESCGNIRNDWTWLKPDHFKQKRGEGGICALSYTHNLTTSLHAFQSKFLSPWGISLQILRRWELPFPKTLNISFHGCTWKHAHTKDCN